MAHSQESTNTMKTKVCLITHWNRHISRAISCMSERHLHGVLVGIVEWILNREHAPTIYIIVRKKNMDVTCTVLHVRIMNIHMPKEAARIWLKVTDVRVERLQEIDEDGAWNEGFRFTIPCLTRISADGHTCDLDGPCTSPIKYCDMTMGELFGRELWNSTIKKSDLDRYGWNANPWVWVIEFELCEKPKGEN